MSPHRPKTESRAFDQDRFAEAVNLAVGRDTYRVAGRRLGISAATLCRVFQGKTPDVETFARICARAKLDPSAFIDLTYETQR